LDYLRKEWSSESYFEMLVYFDNKILKTIVNEFVFKLKLSRNIISLKSMKKVVHWNCSVTVLKLEDKKNLALKMNPKCERLFFPQMVWICARSRCWLASWFFSVFQFFSFFLHSPKSRLTDQGHEQKIYTPSTFRNEQEMSPLQVWSIHCTEVLTIINTRHTYTTYPCNILTFLL
jgi:hypothetical protein